LARLACPLGSSTAAGSSVRPNPDCIQPLAGRDVLILEDNDEAGRKKALETAAAKR